MKVGYLQFNPIFGEKKTNLKRINVFLRQGAEVDADLIVLPELCNTGYAFRSRIEIEKLSEKIPEGVTTQHFEKLSEEYNIHVVLGLCEEDNGKFFNSAILTGPKGFISVYRKSHLFGKEKCWFSKSNGPIAVQRTPKARLGIMICFDWVFPEVARILSLKNAQIICHPANLVLPFCQKALQGTAIHNKVFIITANRVGTERNLKFTGMSQILNPDMEVITRSNETKEEIQVVEINPNDADSKNRTIFGKTVASYIERSKKNCKLAQNQLFDAYDLH